MVAGKRFKKISRYSPFKGIGAEVCRKKRGEGEEGAGGRGEGVGGSSV